MGEGAGVVTQAYIIAYYIISDLGLDVALLARSHFPYFGRIAEVGSGPLTQMLKCPGMILRFMGEQRSLAISQTGIPHDRQLQTGAFNPGMFVEFYCKIDCPILDLLKASWIKHNFAFTAPSAHNSANISIAGNEPATRHNRTKLSDYFSKC